MSKGLIVVICLAVVLVLGGAYAYNYCNNLRTESLAHENPLNAEFSVGVATLSEMVSGFYEQVGVANLKSEQTDKILTDAISGKFGDKGFKSNGSFIAAFTEAGIDLSGLNIYDKIIDYIQAKRAEYKMIQAKLQDRISIYNSWRQEGYVRSYILKNWLHIPSERLIARVGDKVYKGEEALEKMSQVVAAQQAIDAYKSGVMAPMNPKDIK